jgi:membrane protein required for beta-lactamase induction
MKLIALILGLVIERLVTQLLHLRELRWFDRYFDIGLVQIARLRGAPAVLGALVVLGIPVLPVLLVSLAFTDVLWDLPYLAFAVLILLFSLGPRDLGEEVDEYCDAIGRDDPDQAEKIAKELLEADEDSDGDAAVIRAVFIQANNRIFGVVFWFILLGPVGAWLFRVSDLLRRRAVFEVEREPEITQALNCISIIHGVLSWAPARLAALGYAVSGSFDDAFSCWRAYSSSPDAPFYHSNDEVAACVGCGALSLAEGDNQGPDHGARKAMRLVTRNIFVWTTVIALITLPGWA